MGSKEYPWFPSQQDYQKQYIRDNQGTIWLIVLDGGMATTADYSGKVWSAGMEWLRKNYGPLEKL